MSGFVTTPKLGLRKPTYDGDLDQWGNDLNANFDILDNVMTTTAADGKYLPLSGGVMSGNIIIANGNPPESGVSAALQLSANTGGGNIVSGQAPLGGPLWWSMTLGESGAETTIPADFKINRFDDAGHFIDSPLVINRATGHVLMTGGTLTGPLTVDGAFVEVVAPANQWGFLSISRNKGQKALFLGMTDSVGRWAMVPGNDDGEFGINTGSNFTIERYDDSGTLIDRPFTINRATGHVLIGTTIDDAYKLDMVGDVRVRSGLVRINRNTVTLPALPNVGVSLHLGLADGGPGGALIDGFGGLPTLYFRRAQGTAAAPTALANANTIGQLDFSGYDGTAYSTSAAYIRATAETPTGGGGWTSTAHGARLYFATTPPGSTTQAVQMGLTGAGNLLLGNPQIVDPGTYKLDVTGSGRFTFTPGVGFFVLNGSPLTTLPGNPFLPNIASYTIGADGFGVRHMLESFAGGGYLTFRRAAGTSAAPTATAAGMPIGAIEATGRGATSYVNAARAAITFVTGAAWSDTSHGTLITFSTTNDASVTPVEAMRVSPSGNLLIGTTTDTTARLQVNANATAPTFGAVDVALFVGKDGASALAEIVSVAGALTGGGGQAGVVFGRINGTLAAPTALNVDDRIAALQVRGSVAGSYIGAVAAWGLFAGGTWTTTSKPTYHTFTTIANGGVVQTEAMRLTSNANVLIGTTTDGAYKLDVNGAARFNGNPIANGRSTITASTATTTVDPTNIDNSVITLSASTTVTINAGFAGQRLRLEFTQDATGGRVVTLDPASVAFGTDIPSYTNTTTPSKSDFVQLIYKAALSKWAVAAVAKGY